MDKKMIDDLIRSLQKIDSKLQAGQFIAAYREVRRLIAFLEKVKNESPEQNEK